MYSGSDATIKLYLLVSRNFIVSSMTNPAVMLSNHYRVRIRIAVMLPSLYISSPRLHHCLHAINISSPSTIVTVEQHHGPRSQIYLPPLFPQATSTVIFIHIKLHAPTSSTQKLKLVRRGEQFTYIPTLPLTWRLPQTSDVE
jgi:hypothetical protein